MEGIQVSAEVAGSRNQISIIKVGGYIDTTTSSELERALDSLLKQGRFFIVVDLGNVDYISSAGWGIFISEIKSIRENGGDLKLVRMVPDVYEIFELLEFHHILDVYDTSDEAINKFEVLESAGKPVAKEVSYKKPEAATLAKETEPAAAADTSRLKAAQVAAESILERGEISTADLSLTEKIKMIIRANPEYGAYKIKKRLNTVDYGFIKIGWLMVRNELQKLGLDNKNRRYTFATGTNK